MVDFGLQNDSTIEEYDNRVTGIVLCEYGSTVARVV